jgi:hypothetical protein
VEKAPLSAFKELIPFTITQRASKLKEGDIRADNDLHLLQHSGESVFGTALTLETGLISTKRLHQRVPC